MNSIKLSLVYIFLISSVLGVAYGEGDVVVEKLKLFVDGTEFFIKAMCYNPVPLGARLMIEGGYEGGGLCSPKQTPVGDWKSACYDSDYFDGSEGPSGSPKVWFKDAWERDFPIMQDLGVNTLRIYNANPTTRQASLDPNNNVPYPLGKDHIPFMDMAQQYNFKVIFPLFSDYTYIANTKTAQMEEYISWQIDEVGNHPALLMFTYGNELGLEGNTELVNKVNGYIHFARSYMSTKWNRTVPFTSAVVDLPNSYNTLMKDLDVDVFTTNAGYRGISFSDLWSGNSVFDGMYKLSCQYNKPIFIGEIGWMSENGAINEQIPNWFNQIWADLIAHVDQGAIGGAFFEYSDEPYTKDDKLQQHMGVVQFSLNGNSDQAGVYVADTATPRPFIFDSVGSGTFNGIAYNMKTDPFSLLGREPHQLASLTASADVCSADGVPATTGFTPVNPTSGTPTKSSTTGSKQNQGSSTGAVQGSTTGSKQNQGSTTGSVPAGSTTGSNENQGSTTGSNENQGSTGNNNNNSDSDTPQGSSTGSLPNNSDSQDGDGTGVVGATTGFTIDDSSVGSGVSTVRVNMVILAVILLLLL